MNRSDFYDQWSHIHGDAPIKGVVKAWLTISFAVCRTLSKLRVTPNGLTLSSLLFGALFVLLIESNWSIAFLVLSLLADGLDGTMAIITGRVSKWGAALDGVVDRVVETLWAVGLFLLGAPLPIVFTAWLSAFLQEYLRARVAGLGITQVGVVTIAERPVRASLIFIALVARGFDLDLILGVAVMWAIMQLISLLTLTKHLRSQLRQSQR